MPLRQNIRPVPWSKLCADKNVMNYIQMNMHMRTKRTKFNSIPQTGQGLISLNAVKHNTTVII